MGVAQALSKITPSFASADRTGVWGRVGIVMIFGRVHDTLVVGNDHKNVGLLRLVFLCECEQGEDHRDRNQGGSRESFSHFFHSQLLSSHIPAVMAQSGRRQKKERAGQRCESAGLESCHRSSPLFTSLKTITDRFMTTSPRRRDSAPVGLPLPDEFGHQVVVLRRDVVPFSGVGDKVVELPGD